MLVFFSLLFVANVSPTLALQVETVPQVVENTAGDAVDSDEAATQEAASDETASGESDTDADDAAQATAKSYKFSVVHSVQCTEVKNQESTGTCWSFATTSFLEAELLRLGKQELNLSEMFVVKNIYREKGLNYVLRQGKANFSEGALAHDYINAVSRYGVVPESAFNGKADEQQELDHTEMIALLQGVLESVVKLKKPSPRWRLAYDGILDSYLGTSPESFQFEGETYTPRAFAEKLNFNANDYVNITSYTHHPFYESFVLEIPDNFSNGSFLNLPIEEVMAIIDHAIENGYSVAWDGDVSERTFSASQGLAVLPVDANRRDAMRRPGPEQEVTQEQRQATFEQYITTDDHLMHLTGIAVDEDGNRYYMIKNSWGEVGPYAGYLHMSQAYAKLKTVSILIHKDALPAHLRK